MKTKSLLLLLLTYFVTNSFFIHAQEAKPPDWQAIISQPWYQGNALEKPLFFYLDPAHQEEGFFFLADKSLPDIYQVLISRKDQNTLAIKFFKDGKRIKAVFNGTVQEDMIRGKMKFSRKNARRLQIVADFPVFLKLEKPVATPNLPPRYISPVFDKVDVIENISYGAATGYYSTMPLDKESDYDYQQIILDALENMYVNPTKKALLHILNNDPVSLALTDLQSMHFDLYTPNRDTLKNRPLMVLLHGGAFIIGDKATPTVQELAFDFARKGYVVATINYRMGFNPASKSSLERSAYRAVQDARAALRYLSFNASAYNIDPDYVFLGGSSAGAITSLNTAFMKNDERPESSGANLWRMQKDLGGLDESTNTLLNTFSIKAVANLWGAVNDTSIIDKEEQIPVLSFHGDADKIVPFAYNYPFTDLDTTWTSNIVGKLYGSLFIDKRLKNQGIHSELVVFPGAGHEPQYEQNSYARIMNTIMTRTTDFYFRSMFYFPEIKGPGQVAVGMQPPVYSLPAHDDLSYYWKVSGGKIIPGAVKNQVRVAWLSEETGNISLVLIHKNQANLELVFPVSLPGTMMNYFPAEGK